ncbi:MAG: helix-turn-helix domain-containing protein [Marinilabiliaceae bacterium]|nr:helix-turn-helix domain-containing protein [Marinilabiliaceae bacterium]
MQAHYHKLPEQFHQSVSVRKDIRPYFLDKWHYHSKLELVYIIRGKGTRFIGDDISGFKDGDLVLLGTHLPHVWKSKDKYFEKKNVKTVEAIILHFPQKMGINNLFDLPEMNAIKNLIEQSHLGLHFDIPEFHPVKKSLKKMVNQSPFDRILTLLSILQRLATEEGIKQSLSKTPFADHYQSHQSKRVDRIYNHILHHFDKEIKLEHLASIANMTPASLCRFFKQKTKKSLSEFTNEVRIGFACKLIIEDKLSISDICFRCGYNSLSYFNRQFKKITGMAPTLYQKKSSSSTSIE